MNITFNNTPNKKLYVSDLTIGEIFILKDSTYPDNVANIYVMLVPAWMDGLSKVHLLNRIPTVLPRKCEVKRVNITDITIEVNE